MADTRVDIEKLRYSRRDSLPYELASSRGQRRPTNSSSASSKSRHYSLGTIYECRNARFANIYGSNNSSEHQNFRQSLTIHEEIDAGEPPPVDESLFFDNLLISKNTDLNQVKTALWSILSAQEMKAVLDVEKGEFSHFFHFDKRLHNLSYLWACFRNLPNHLPKLECLGSDPAYVEPTTGMNAVLIASLAESSSCLEYLIVKKQLDVNVLCKINDHSPLHFAALANSSTIAELLLNNGAKVNLECQEPVLHSAIRAGSTEVLKLLLKAGADVAVSNHLGESSLHIACFAQSLASVELLLQTPKVDINSTNCINRTPLHYAVMNNAQEGSSLDLVDILLKHKASVNAYDQANLTPLHIAALNELSDCVEHLIWAGADISATTSTGHTALNIISRKIPESLHVLRDRLDSCIKLQRPVSHNKEFEMSFHFDLLFPTNDPCETSFINTFVQEHRKDLLSHPLVMAFLHLKWEKIRSFYLFRILISTLTVFFITTYVLTALAYKCHSNEDGTYDKICSNDRLSGFFYKKSVIEAQWYLAIVLICISIPRNMLGFLVYKSARQYFSNIDNVLDSIVLVSFLATSFIYTGKTHEWQKYVGAFGVLCAWTNLMLMVGQLPTFGTYVTMFTHIQFEFAKLLLAYSGLLIGFALSFCVIFVSEPSFGNPFTGLIKVLAMMTGELDFEGLINQDILDNSYIIYHPISVCSQILFTLFIIFVTVILMNLLVGIAVHDIQSLRNHAGLTKLVRQTKMILFTEMILCNENLPCLLRKWLSHFSVNIGNRNLILVVKPLNTLEKRLPKDILKEAYKIAHKHFAFGEQISTPEGSFRDVKFPAEAAEGDLNLQEQVLNCLLMKVKEQEIDLKIIKEQLANANKILEFLYKKMFV